MCKCVFYIIRSFLFIYLFVSCCLVIPPYLSIERTLTLNLVLTTTEYIYMYIKYHTHTYKNTPAISD